MRLTVRSFFQCFSLVVFVLFSLETSAQNPQNGDIAKPIDALTSELDKLEQDIEKQHHKDKDLIRFQKVVEAVSEKAKKYREELKPRLEELKSQIKKLGPLPVKNAPPEALEITAERTRLNDVLNSFDAASKRAEVIQTRAQQIVGKIHELRRSLFTRQLFKRRQIPYSYKLWQDVIDAANAQFSLVKNLSFIWIDQAHPLNRIFGLFALAFIVWLVLKGIAVRIINANRKTPVHEDPEFFCRAVSVVWVSLTRMAPILIALGIVYAGLVTFDALTPQINALTQAAYLSLSVFVVIAAFARTLLAPNTPQWRLFPLSDQSAMRVRWLVLAIAAIYVIDLFLVEWTRVLYAPLKLTIAQNFVTSLIFAFLLIALLLTPLKPENTTDRKPSRIWPIWLKLPLWLLALAILISAALGYVALARFLASQIVLTGSVIAGVILLRLAIGELTSDLANSSTPIGTWLARTFRFGELQRRQFAMATGLLLNIMLLVFAVPLFLFQWGFAWSDIRGWLSTAFFGFQLGSINLSIATLLIAAALFTAGLLVTRAIQKWLDQNALAIPRLRSGLTNSVRTGIGYVGFILSALLAVSYLGLDFTNLAIVAGALSVGIGFGLQSIVNNFVSGIILLVERPVKIGDWVIIGDDEGFVRRINVRATEIETFDRSSVIIPNSELITGKVINWTHGNSVGRVFIRVGVAYASDAKQVYDLLMKIGKDHPKTIERPKPKVVFEDFGASSLDFSLRVYVADINDSLEVRTDLRMMILNAFREHGIEIAFPQLDVHVKNLKDPHLTVSEKDNSGSGV